MIKPAGLILAGGLASRMGGGDKVLHKVGGKLILTHIVSRMAAQCAALVINANGDPARFGFAGLPVVPDGIPGFVGPLAGILAGLDWVAEHQPALTHLLSVPGDCPFLPRDLVSRLEQAREQQNLPLACAQSGEHRHHAICLWPVALRDDLRKALTGENLRSVWGWAARYGAAVAEWPDSPFDPFLNINTPEDLRRADAIAATLADA